MTHADATAANRRAGSRYESAVPHLQHADLAAIHDRCVQQLLAAAAPPVTVLDIGAGTGTSTQAFLERGAHVTAVDLSQLGVQNTFALIARRT
jgi:2-polyprenyl-3-methyl-5-hydroxy-6-metoxy-1,4-benzoquinol methylase